MKTRIQIRNTKCIQKLLVLFLLLDFYFLINSFAQSDRVLPAVLTPTVTCDSVLQTSTCAGGNLIVRFHVSGGSFNFGNVFTAQLSNLGGAFTTPINIGSIPFNTGIILATIPASTNFGIYKVRVITNNPVDTSNASPNFILVSQIAQLNQIVASPHNYVCPGDSITLTAINIASAYSWSTGATTQSIKVGQPNIYKVTTTDALTCQSTAIDTLLASACLGVGENIVEQQVSVFPNPANDHFNLQLRTGNPVDADVTLMNPLGEILLKTKLHLSNNNERTIGVAAFPSGIYFLKVQTMGFIETKRIEIIR